MTVHGNDLQNDRRGLGVVNGGMYNMSSVNSSGNTAGSTDIIRGTGDNVSTNRVSLIDNGVSYSNEHANMGNNGSN